MRNIAVASALLLASVSSIGCQQDILANDPMAQKAWNEEMILSEGLPREYRNLVTTGTVVSLIGIGCLGIGTGILLSDPEKVNYIGLGFDVAAIPLAIVSLVLNSSAAEKKRLWYVEYKHRLAEKANKEK